MSPADEDLLDRALEGGLSDEEERALVDRLTREPDLARRIVERSRDEALLAEWAEERRALSRERPSAGARWSWRPLVAAAALLVTGILAIVLWPRPPGTADAYEIVAAEGTVDVFPGDHPLPGGAIHCGIGGRASVRYGDGTTLEIREKTELAPDRHEVRLFAGSVAAHVMKLPPGESFAIETPHAEARVLGTRFELTVGAGWTRLEVEEGAVLFRKKVGGPPLTVRAGQFAVARPDRDPAAHPLHGTGLRGEYYDAPDLTRPKLARLDPAVDFDWGVGSPDPSIQADGFSVRWSGRVLPRYGETYTFSTVTDDGARLWVNGRLLIDQFHQQTKTRHDASIDLVAWEPVDLRMEYVDSVGPASAKLLWSSASTPERVIPQESLFPPSASGSGLKGEYFGRDNLTDLRWVRVDPAVDFDWGLRPPDPAVGPEHFSVRWTGQVEATASETVTFTTRSDDGVRLWVDGQLLIDDWTVRGTTERSGRIELVAGRRYDLKLEYFQCVSTATVKLLWASPGQPQQVIPANRLFPAP
jgi:ferric-dicitrate binding protein FerR (iron transport regulator)